MKCYIILSAIVLIQFNSYTQEKQESNKFENILLSNISVLTMNTESVLVHQDVWVKNGKIASIEPTTNINPKYVKVIDGTGKYLMPSLADAHVHLPKSKSDTERILKLNLINGVTKLRSMRGDWKHIEWRAELNAEGSNYPRLYLSPPPISRKFDLNLEQLERYVTEAKGMGFDFIKMLSIKDEMFFKQLDSLCKINGLPIGGHFPKNVSDSIYFKSNVNSIEHLGGLFNESQIFNERLVKIKENDIFICPTLQWYIIGGGLYSVDYMVNQNGMNYMDPDIVKEWAEKSTAYRNEMGTEAFEVEVLAETKKINEKLTIIKKLNDNGVKLLLSPDSSSKFILPGFGVIEEMKTYEKAGLSNFDILKTATVNFALLFDENTGTIEVGGDADFIITEKNPLENLDALKNIEAVYFNKQFLNKENLRQMSEKLEIKN